MRAAPPEDPSSSRVRRRASSRTARSLHRRRMPRWAWRLWEPAGLDDHRIGSSLADARCRVWKTIARSTSRGERGEGRRGAGVIRQRRGLRDPYLFAIVFLPFRRKPPDFVVPALSTADNSKGGGGLAGRTARGRPGGVRRPPRARSKDGPTDNPALHARPYRTGPLHPGQHPESAPADPMGAREHHRPGSPDELLRSPGRANRIAIVALAAVFALALIGPSDRAEAAGCVALALLLLMELVAEPSRLVAVQFEPDGADVSAEQPLLWTAPAGVKLDADAARPDGDPRSGFRTPRAATHDGRHAGPDGPKRISPPDPDGEGGGFDAHQVVGYLFRKRGRNWRSPTSGTSPSRRRTAATVRAAGWSTWPANSSRTAGRRFRPSSWRPATRSPSLPRARVRRVAGVDYTIPNNENYDDCLRYNPMFFPLPACGRARHAAAAQAIQAMRPNYGGRRDPRLKALKKSFAEMRLIPPSASAAPTEWPARSPKAGCSPVEDPRVLRPASLRPSSSWCSRPCAGPRSAHHGPGP